MTDGLIRTSVAGAVATVALHRPESLNAITPEMLEELADELRRLAADGSVGLIVLTGSGRAFSAGVDLKSLQGRSLPAGAVGGVLDGPARSVIELICTMPKVVVARVNGFCFTGALELALACDLIVVAEEAVFGDTHAKFGLRPTWGMSQRLIRTVGITRARELSYTARRFTGVEAAAWGLALRAVPLAELDAAVDELATAILANSAGSVAAYKQLYRTALDVGLTDGLAIEASTTFDISDGGERLAEFR